MNRKITPQPASKTPGKFAKQIVQLDACNIDNESATDKPHSRVFFRGGDILAELEHALRLQNQSAELLGSGPRFFIRIPVSSTITILESIGFKREIDESNLYFRATK